MIPVYLQIKGLYSYKEPQEIDFTALTSSGLFGIFGAVGSGKSSILEAIMFVLYDKSDRLNYSGDNRYYNMLNLQSDELMLDFVFYAGHNNADKYRFRFVARRNKKDFEKVEVKESSRYKWQKDEWMPLEHVKDAEGILGMSYQNFMQTIIIPQGRFREFIDRSASERTKMLKELFHLNKYDLSQKTSILIKINKERIDILDGRLQELGDIDETYIESKKELLKEAKDFLETEDLKCKAAKAEEQTLQIHRNLFEQIKKLELDKAHLDAQKESFEIKEKELQAYEKAFTYFKEKIKVREGVADEVHQAMQNKVSLKDRYVLVQEESLTNEAIYQAAKEAYQNKDQIKQKYEDLETIIKIKALQEDTCKLQDVIVSREKQKEAAGQSLNELKQFIKEKEQLLDSLEKNIPDTSQIQQVLHWFQKKEDILHDLDHHRLGLVHHQDKLKKVELEKARVFSNGKATMGFREIAFYLKEEWNQLEEQKKTISKEIQKLLVQQNLSDLTISLNENDPCPLCGSLHHPEILQVHEVHDLLANNEAKLAELVKQQNALRNQESVLHKLELEHGSQIELLQEKETEIAKTQEKILIHEKAFEWPAFKDANLPQLSKKKKEMESQLLKATELKTEIRKAREAIPLKENYFNELNETLIKSENEMCSLEATHNALKTHLKQLKFEKFEKFTHSQLMESLKKGQQQYKKIEEEYESAVNKKQQLILAEEMLKERISWSEKEESQLKNKMAHLESEILQSLIDNGFESLQQVIKILSQSINMEDDRKALQQFQKEVHTNETALSKCHKDADGFIYDQAYHDELIGKVEGIENRINALREEIILLTQDIEDKTRRLAIKKSCEDEREMLIQRELNLKELRKLFMGNGFVRYVSTVYLQDLCKAANQRFLKLTNNNLSLELNSEEDFIVRDYLNNGKTRLLKTLSGGQTFQAALCLALALAENVKSLNEADQSFFFLDEGFGSLDRDSLRVVFDTLKTLRKENRIVGIISHVEELQQEIDVYLKIVNDKDKGSLVSYSWI